MKHMKLNLKIIFIWSQLDKNSRIQYSIQQISHMVNVHGNFPNKIIHGNIQYIIYLCKLYILRAEAN